MKTARLAVLGVALAAGIGAAFLASGSKPPEVAAAPPPPVVTDDVLVAAKELNRGAVVGAGDLRWQPWPKELIPDGTIRKSTSPGGIEEQKDLRVCNDFAMGVPVPRNCFGNGGFLADKLPPGRRAVAINIDTQGSSTAGGFILPKNRVDVIHIFHDEDAARKGIGNTFVSQTILTNIRVLAIGQNVQEKNGEQVIVGATATLELTPSQAETVILAQRTGQLSLDLRGMADANAADEQPQSNSNGLTVIRNGVADETGRVEHYETGRDKHVVSREQGIGHAIDR
jgi:pilus assembly protein CpaB